MMKFKTSQITSFLILLSFSGAAEAARNTTSMPSDLYDHDRPVISSELTKSSVFDINAYYETIIRRSLDDDQNCVERTSTQKNASDPKVSSRVVALENCAPQLLQQELKSAFGVCPSGRIKLDVDSTERHSRSASAGLNQDCDCFQYLNEYHQKTTINPLRIFQGPPYSKLLEIRGCSLAQLLDLVSSPSEREKAVRAYRNVEERLSKTK